MTVAMSRMARISHHTIATASVAVVAARIPISELWAAALLLNIGIRV